MIRVRAPDVRPETAPADFVEFFRREYPRLAGALYLVTGNASEAEDMAQEAMARAFERWDRVGRMASPGGWVYRTALNVNRHRRRSFAIARRWSPRGPVVSPDPEGWAITRSDLLRALSSLPHGQRAALILVEWVGLDAIEAGRVLGIAAGSVRSRVSRARAVLGERLEVDDG